MEQFGMLSFPTVFGESEGHSYFNFWLLAFDNFYFQTPLHTFFQHIVGDIRQVYTYVCFPTNTSVVSTILSSSWGHLFCTSCFKCSLCTATWNCPESVDYANHHCTVFLEFCHYLPHIAWWHVTHWLPVVSLHLSGFQYQPMLPLLPWMHLTL